ncbi:phage holin family protein [Foetidibacter luteolus]|uniref:phage holin family protein n=1 Tax=Foetidibacter luteolus TaxID=2608880 RepID=UPI00129A62F9|nr:phage holin family protein [Foetidibacter luteolus]
MDKQDTQENFFAQSKEKLEQYVKDRLLLFKLQMVEKTSKLIASMFIGLMITIISLFILIFLSIMGGYYFANLLGNLYWGFGVIAGIYLLLLILLIVLGKRVVQLYITNMIIEIFFDQTAENDDEHEDKISEQ